jgi:hypothetical protein
LIDCEVFEMKPLLAALAALAALPALAEEKRSADPSNAAAPVPPLRYESAFAGYKSARDEKPVPWKQTNEEVAGSGHASHAQPAQAKKR